MHMFRRQCGHSRVFFTSVDCYFCFFVHIHGVIWSFCQGWIFTRVVFTRVVFYKGVFLKVVFDYLKGGNLDFRFFTRVDYKGGLGFPKKVTLDLKGGLQGWK